MLKDTLLKFLKIDGLIENLTGYLETRVQLLKLEVKEEVAGIIAKAILIFLISFVFLLFIGFISFSAAYYLSSFIGRTLGFATVAGIYLLIGIILVIFRKGISEKFEKKIVEAIQQKG